jgi:hypothetical protein
VAAMEQANLEPIIIEDLVKFGEDRGVERVYERQFSRRLKRPLSAPEREILQRRIDTLGVDRIDELVLMWRRSALESWLADPAAR